MYNEVDLAAGTDGSDNAGGDRVSYDADVYFDSSRRIEDLVEVIQPFASGRFGPLHVSPWPVVYATNWDEIVSLRLRRKGAYSYWVAFEDATIPLADARAENCYRHLVERGWPARLERADDSAEATAEAWAPPGYWEPRLLPWAYDELLPTARHQRWPSPLWLLVGRSPLETHLARPVVSRALEEFRDAGWMAFCGPGHRWEKGMLVEAPPSPRSYNDVPRILDDRASWEDPGDDVERGVYVTGTEAGGPIAERLLQRRIPGKPQLLLDAVWSELETSGVEPDPWPDVPPAPW